MKLSTIIKIIKLKYNMQNSSNQRYDLGISSIRWAALYNNDYKLYWSPRE